MAPKEAEIKLASTRADSGVAGLLRRDDELAQLYDLVKEIGQPSNQYSTTCSRTARFLRGSAAEEYGDWVGGYRHR